MIQMNWNHHLDKPYFHLQQIQAGEMWWISPWYNDEFEHEGVSEPTGNIK